MASGPLRRWVAVVPPFDAPSPTLRASRSAESTAALAALAVPLSNAILTGDHLLRSIPSGHWIIAGFDIGAIALAAGFVALARATRRRARSGPAESVWALPRAAAAATDTAAAGAKPMSGADAR